MANFYILQLVLLVILFHLVKFVFGKENESDNEYLTPRRNLSKSSTIANVEISGLKFLPQAEEEKIKRFTIFKEINQDIAETFAMESNDGIRKRRLHSKARRSLQF